MQPTLQRFRLYGSLAGLLMAFLAGRLFAASYHLDSQAGDDTFSGTAPDRSWRSLERANAFVFQPGDRLLLKAGTRYVGCLKPQGSGALVAGQTVPILIDLYGEGPLPRIEAEGRALDALLLRNVEFWEVRNLELTNLGTNRQPWRTGVRIVSDGFGKMRHLRLHNLFVHDVNGHLSKNREGCGIFFEARGGNQAHFDDLLIENCRLLRTDRNGICQRGGGEPRSLRVVIRGNRLEDIGGDGIKTWGSRGALIERNVLRGGRTRCEDYAAGIWPFDCDGTIIQYNEVSGMKGIKDGQAFDSDYRCRDSLFQYNYSHDNEGGFMLICTPGTSWNDDTIIRYNISQNDGLNTARVFHFAGAPARTLVYNNTIYIGPTQNLPLLLFTEWNRGWAQDTHFFNNLVYVDGRVSFQWGQSQGSVIESNLFYGLPAGTPPDPPGSTNRPPLRRPGGAGDGFASLEAYALLARPDFMLGWPVPDGPGRDIFGTPLPAGRPPCLGAAEFAGEARKNFK
jgi:hypothetical protein